MSGKKSPLLFTMKCDYCGKEFERWASQIHDNWKAYCSKECMCEGQAGVIRAISPDGKIVVPGRDEKISVCYLKEAKAMLHGMHWEGKNRCVKLQGDEE